MLLTMSDASALHQALEEPRFRVAEEAMSRWLAAPDLDALRRELPTLSLEFTRKAGVMLEGAMLLGLVPRSTSVLATVADLSRKAQAFPAKTLQDRWSVPSLPFDFGRLRQRLHEFAVSGPSPSSR